MRRIPKPLKNLRPCRRVLPRRQISVIVERRNHLTQQYRCVNSESSIRWKKKWPNDQFRKQF